MFYQHNGWGLNQPSSLIIYKRINQLMNSLFMYNAKIFNYIAGVDNYWLSRFNSWLS